MNGNALSHDESIDGLFRDKVRVIQSRKGYRVSEDALILAWFTRPEPHERFLDAGTGCGVISFGIVIQDPTVSAVGLEIQDGLARRAARSARLNHLEERVWIVRGDVRHADRFFRPGSFDAVVSNPPYHEWGKGKINPEEEKALARHQLMMPPEELFVTASVLLGNEGRICVIYPYTLWERIAEAIHNAGFFISRVLRIYSHKQAEVRLFCAEGVIGDPPKTVEEDNLILYSDSGARSSRAQAILEGRYIH